MFSTSLLISLQHWFTGPWVQLMHGASILGGYWVFLVVIPFLYWSVNRRRAHYIAFYLLVSVWLTTFLKDMVAIARPSAESGITVFAQNLSNGFPSMITANATLFWSALSTWAKSVWFSVISAIIIILVALSRLVLGLNSLADVLAGLGIGLILLFWLTWRYHPAPYYRFSKGARVATAIIICVVLMFLDVSSTTYAALGLLVGWVVTNVYALEWLHYEESTSVVGQIIKLLLGYLGLGILLEVVLRFLPVGLPEFLGFALISCWITIGAPALFQMLGLSGTRSGFTSFGDSYDTYGQRHSTVRAFSWVSAVTSVIVAVLTVLGVQDLPAKHESVPAMADAAGAEFQANPLPQPGDGLVIQHQSTLGRPFAVLGHKGSAATEPEETLPSFRQAVKLGVDFLDLDLRMTKDHHFILLHNETVDATTNGHGSVADMTLAQIEKLDAGYWMTTDGGKTYPFRGKGIHLMSLDQFLKTFPHQQINIEMKNDDPTAGSDLAKVIAANHAQNRVVVGSFWGPPLDVFRQKMPQVRSMITQNEMITAFVMAHLGLEAYWKPPGTYAEIPEVRGPLRVVTPGFVDFLHEHGLTVYVWTVDDKPAMLRLMQMGVDGIISDNPALLLKAAKPS